MSDDAFRVPPHPGVRHLFGRDHDLETIELNLSEGRDVAVVAAAGMGKTSLAFEILRRLAVSGWQTIWVPAAQTASAADLVDVVVSQLAEAPPAPEQNDPERYLGLALERLAEYAAERGTRTALVVDDLDSLFAAGRSAGIGEFFTRKLRAICQRSTDLSVLYLMRSDLTLRDVFADPDSPLFAGTATHRLESLSVVACWKLIEEMAQEVGRQVTSEAHMKFAHSCRGVPLYLALAANAALVDADQETGTIDLEDAEKAVNNVFIECAPVTQERMESIRRSHRMGLEVARRLAVGTSPYAGEKAPNNVTRALRNLERLGLARQPEEREWMLTDPFLERALQQLEPKAVAAHTSTVLQALPTNLPSSDRALRRLRGNQLLGLSRHWFEPDTAIRDAIHGEVMLNRLELAIVETPEFQRLRRIKQLGTVQLLFPGATHSRWEHSVGVLASVSRVLETLNPSDSEPSLVRPKLPLASPKYWLGVLALGRIAGLVHHLTTIPYAGVLESELEQHLLEAGTRFERVWHSVVEDLAEDGLAEHEANSLASGRFYKVLRQILIGGDRDEGDYLFLRDLLRGPISANSFDSIARDRQALGLSGSYSSARIASAMKLVETDDVEEPGCRLALWVDRDDARGDFLQHLYLLTQYEEVVTRHRMTRAADAMVAAAVDHWVRATLEQGEDDGEFMEDQLFRYSEDGLIDYLRDVTSSAQALAPARQSVWQLAATHHLAECVSSRRIYPLVASSGGGARVAAQIHSEYGAAERRRDLEDEAARIAEIEEPGRILLSIPRPPKPAFGEVLVGDGKSVVPLRERSGKFVERIFELEERTQRNWSVDVFVDPDLPAGKREKALSWLASKLLVRWE